MSGPISDIGADTDVLAASSDALEPSDDIVCRCAKRVSKLSLCVQNGHFEFVLFNSLVVIMASSSFKYDVISSIELLESKPVG